ncbi:MAG: NAD(P)H-binding protein, partial [Rhodospirillaceae bacterium]|nr:NAD(P)H-binding protein [Rhodospirillaceae bacterium]
IAFAAVMLIFLAALSWLYVTSNHQNVEAWVFSSPQPKDQPNDEAVAPDDGYLIFGASRNTGLDVAEILVARGEKVSAVVRPNSDTAALQKLGVTLIPGDALDMASVRAAMTDKRYRVVLTTISCFSCAVRPDYLGNKNIFDAAAELGQRRVVLVTTIGAGDSFAAAPMPAKIFLKEMLPLKTQAEDHLKAVGLDYTIIRPGGLKTATPTGRGLLTEDRRASGIITRADLAGLIVQAMDDDKTIGKTLAAIDRDFKFPFDMR